MTESIAGSLAAERSRWQRIGGWLERIGGFFLVTWSVLFVLAGLVRGVQNLTDGVSGGERTRLVVVGVVLLVIAAIATLWAWVPGGKRVLRFLGRCVQRVSPGLGVLSVAVYQFLIVVLLLLAVLLLPLSPSLSQIVARLHVTTQLLLLFVLCLVADLLLYPLRSERSVRRLFTHGWLSVEEASLPLVGIAIYWLVAVSAILMLFTALILVELDQGWVQSVQPAQDLIDRAVPGKLIVWNALSVVPGLDITTTVGWSGPPLAVDSLRRGWIIGGTVVAFKGIILGTALATVGRVWKLRQLPGGWPRPAGSGVGPERGVGDEATDLSGVALLSPVARSVGQVIRFAGTAILVPKMVALVRRERNS